MNNYDSVKSNVPVFVAQLEEHAFPMPQICSSNPVIGKKI